LAEALGLQVERELKFDIMKQVMGEIANQWQFCARVAH